MSDERVKLGETCTVGEKLFVATSLYQVGVDHPFVVWTPVPSGMTEMDLGRKFEGAWIGSVKRSS